MSWGRRQAGHIRFGARTGGTLVILGVIVLLTGLFLSDSVALLFQVFPRPVLGVILFFAGVELALVIRDIKLKRQNLFVLVVTAGMAIWNMGVAYLARSDDLLRSPTALDQSMKRPLFAEITTKPLSP